MKKNVIISGLSGQDGSIMADYLLENTDLDIYGIIRSLSVPNHENIEHLKSNKRVNIIEGDITDPHSMTGIISKLKPDYFINFAANSFVGDSWKMPYQVFETNTMSVLHQLEIIRTLSKHTRYYQAGSSEEFGDVRYHPQDEKHPLRPRSPYGASKAASRGIVKTYRESYKLYAVAGWLFNHESERRGSQFVTRKITQGVARINKAIIDKKAFNPIELGNLEAKRDWSYSGDFVDGIWRMLNQEKYNKELARIIAYEHDSWGALIQNISDYVLASGETHSIIEFIEQSFAAAGIEGYWRGDELNKVFVLVNYINDIAEVKSQILVKVNPEFYRPAEVEILLGDSSRARQELGWKPKLSFKDLVYKMTLSDIKLTEN